VSRDGFLGALASVYSDGHDGSWKGLLRVGERHAEIATSTHPDSAALPFRLHFAGPGQRRWPPRPWRGAAELPPCPDPARRPLEGLRIALDPGHIGGRWAAVEERHFQIGGGAPVQEGTMTLTVARHLRPLLERLGAVIYLLRDGEEPVTGSRPADFLAAAEAALERRGVAAGAAAGAPGLSVEREAARLFYRTREIYDRARLVNEVVKPDLVLCLHFNAEPWGDPERPAFSAENHFHLLVNGCYSRGEIGLDDQRFALCLHLLRGKHAEEIAVGRSLAAALASATGLRPYIYTTANARLVGESPYLYARNLLANRAYHCPVAFLEPYVMNCEEVYLRVQAGDYRGEREVAGARRASIYREYAGAVADGLAGHYREARSRTPR
jgi:hypothetical protein